MTIAATDLFEKAQGLSLTDIPDGLAVHDAEGKDVHFLNPVAGAVLLLCDGAHDGSRIAAILQEEFGLAEAPVQQVLTCLVELEACGVIHRL